MILVPKIGDIIYVPTQLFMDHGEDDFHGGKATISHIEERYGKVWIAIQERPGTIYEYSGLLNDQKELKERFGNEVAYPDPDPG